VNKDSPVGRVMTLEDAMTFWTRCQEAEKVMGKLSREERLAILGTIGKEVTVEELKDLCAGKKVLVIKEKDNASQEG
jgi:hypothetical protein